MGVVTDTSISARVVLYGPPGAGKSHTLNLIASKLKEGQKGELRTDEIEGAACEILPVSLGEIKGKKTEFEFVAAPGDWKYTDARRALLEGVDGLIFIADSSGASMGDNQQSLTELKGFLQDFGKSLVATPVVFQWNNQKTMGAMPPDEMTAKLNEVRAPAFGVAENDAKGIFQAFTTISKITLKKVREDFEAGLLQPAPVAAPEPQSDPEPEPDGGVTADDLALDDDLDLPPALDEIPDVTGEPDLGVVPGGGDFDLDDDVEIPMADTGASESDIEIPTVASNEPATEEPSSDLEIPMAADDDQDGDDDSEASFSPTDSDFDDALVSLDALDEAPFDGGDLDDDLLSPDDGLNLESSAPSSPVTVEGGSGVEVVSAGDPQVGEDGRIEVPVTLRSSQLGGEVTIHIAIQIR